MTNQENCYFCGAEYTETWPLEDLAEPVCPECCLVPTAALQEMYPGKVETLSKDGKVFRVRS